MNPYYVHCQSFDGDLLALNLRREHPDWIERRISGTVASELQKQKDEAIAQHKDFAFETNFSNNLILNMIGEFKEAGYKITLLYFGLGSLEESTTRVMQRKMFGGLSRNLMGIYSQREMVCKLHKRKLRVWSDSNSSFCMAFGNNAQR